MVELATPSMPRATDQFEAIGTRWQIELWGRSESVGPEPGDQFPEASCLAAVRRRIDQFDRHYSRFRTDSLVSTMATAPGRYQLPADAAPLLGLYRQLYQLTDGAFTPLVGQLLSDAGYDATYSLQPRPLQPTPAWEAALAWDGQRRLDVKAPVLLDFGAAGKGYLVDLVADIIRAHGFDEFSIDAGGDLLEQRSLPQRIGLEHPNRLGEAIGLAHVQSGSLCGSATNRRRWGEYHHIMDPHQLQSVRRIQAAWVAAPTALVADALATALFLVPPATLTAHFRFEYVLVRADDSAEMSAGFPGELFS